MLLVRVFEIGVLAVTKIRPNPLHHLALLGFGEYAGSAGDPVVVITRIECVLAPVKAPPPSSIKAALKEGLIAPKITQLC